DLPPTILCQSHNQPDVTLLQKDRMLAGKNLDCIVGAFVSDLTPCAPRGGFGLSAPTGSVALVGVTDRWQDYTDHLGGITGHAVTSDRIIFSGGFNSPSGGYDEKWRFEVSRLSGKGLLVQDGKPEVEYSCRAADRKF
ncbi:MAG: hypothetical protein J0H57_04065, partial [Rhodospirillales bacterium]|nr:hypothetical protein [Rhodospirillales bacterium]